MTHGFREQLLGCAAIHERCPSKVRAVFRLHDVAYILIRITNLLRAQEVMV